MIVILMIVILGARGGVLEPFGGVIYSLVAK